ncbi:MAG: flagellar hook protein FlgE [bacterium]|nr:flagellar hook protein FlgE [bacterium]
MRLFSGLFIGREALMTQGAALATAADNIANSNTTGFKTQRTDFANLIADSEGSLFGSSLETGNGVKAQEITTIHNQGPVETTDRALDFAIKGDGYFVVNDGTSQYYSRAGNFQTNADGILTDILGNSVMGYTTLSPDTLSAIDLDALASTASATTGVEVTGNLDIRTPVTAPPANPRNFRALEDAASFFNAVRAVDSLGVIHDVSLYFYHSANNADPLNFTVEAYVDGAEAGGQAGVPTLIGTSQMNFLPDGSQAQGAGTVIAATVPWSNGAEPGVFDINLTSFTSFGNRSFLNSVARDGLSAGTVIGTVIEKNGDLYARLDSGERVLVGTLAIADFANVNGLDKTGNNNFIESNESGTANVGKPLSDGRGEIQGEALESSTVDLAGEFVSIMKFQRGYQAGSQVIQTVNELLNTTLQIA